MRGGRDMWINKIVFGRGYVFWGGSDSGFFQSKG